MKAVKRFALVDSNETLVETLQSWPMVYARKRDAENALKHPLFRQYKVVRVEIRELRKVKPQ